MRKQLTAVLLACLALSTVTACGSKDEGGKAAGGDEQVTIGVVQYAPHPALDASYEGFLDALKEGGYEEGKNLTLDFTNSQGSEQDAAMAAKNIVTKKPNLVLGIATPAAMALYSSTKNADIPLVFTAVSDPVAAKLVESNEKPGTNVTGSSDRILVKPMLEMIKEFLPEAKKVGIVYTTSEPNSVVQVADFKEAAKELGLEIVDQGVTNESEIAAGVASLIAKGVDAIQNTTDNNIVNNVSVVVKAATEAGIPVFGSEEGQVANGCVAAQGIDYFKLGREAGMQAVKILKGEKASEMPVVGLSEGTPVYSEEALQAVNLKLPDVYKDAQKVTK